MAIDALRRLISFIVLRAMSGPSIGIQPYPSAWPCHDIALCLLYCDVSQKLPPLVDSFVELCIRALCGYLLKHARPGCCFADVHRIPATLPPGKVCSTRGCREHQVVDGNIGIHQVPDISNGTGVYPLSALFHARDIFFLQLDTMGSEHCRYNDSYGGGVDGFRECAQIDEELWT